MATTIRERTIIQHDIRSAFIRWETMSDDELLHELQQNRNLLVTTKSRMQTIAGLVDWFVARMI